MRLEARTRVTAFTRTLLGASAGQPVGPFDDARDFNAGVGPELGEDVPDVGLDGLRAEEQLLGNLAVRPALHDEAPDLELALGKGFDPCTVGRPGLGAPVDVLPELAQLALGRIPVALRAHRVQ